MAVFVESAVLDHVCTAAEVAKQNSGLANRLANLQALHVNDLVWAAAALLYGCKRGFWFAAVRHPAFQTGSQSLVRLGSEIGMIASCGVGFQRGR
jgi:hypothetical protein